MFTHVARCPVCSMVLVELKTRTEELGGQVASLLLSERRLLHAKASPACTEGLAWIKGWTIDPPIKEKPATDNVMIVRSLIKEICERFTVNGKCRMLSAGKLCDCAKCQIDRIDPALLASLCFPEKKDEVEALRRVNTLLWKALRGVGNVRQFPDQLCWCDTIAGTYCVGQPQCEAATEALAVAEKHAKAVFREKIRLDTEENKNG